MDLHLLLQVEFLLHPWTTMLFSVGGPAIKLSNFFWAPNIIFSVGSCMYILYDLTCQVWMENSTHNQSYGV
jgi:hypothetical protein